jgi:hypothetical protein
VLDDLSSFYQMPPRAAEFPAEFWSMIDEKICTQPFWRTVGKILAAFRQSPESIRFGE